MNGNARKLVTAIVLALAAALLVIARITTTSETVLYTAWSLLPPLFAIVLALLTKEVYSSLFAGILTGALLYSGFSFEGTMLHVFKDGVIAVMADPYNFGILIFIVILGTMVSLMNKAGGSAAFGRWASGRFKTRVGAQLATIILGLLIFIDDYFNCLTVGSVMRPVTDKYNVSRAKLAYLIDATAAPVCIIAPISSWAAAVAGFVEGEDGFSLFVRAIPYNFYALLTIVMMVGIVLLKTDYGPMAVHEANSLKGDLYTTPDRPYENVSDIQIKGSGKVLDLVLPVLALIISCVISIIYTGGFFEGTGFIEAFSNCDASLGLVLGSSVALVLTMIFYLSRKVLNYADCMNSLPDGFKAMVPAILILVFAWTLKAMTDSLGAAKFVAELVSGSAAGFQNLLPAIIFLIAVGLSFSTGTSWGTFGILIPIVVNIFSRTDPMLIISISACMAGSVCGDHCSPISDTTIMSSAGAQCNHVNHVSTQLPYALTCAAISFLTYIVAGFLKTWLIALPVGIILTLGLLFVIKAVKEA